MNLVEFAVNHYNAIVPILIFFMSVCLLFSLWCFYVAIFQVDNDDLWPNTWIDRLYAKRDKARGR